MAATQGLTDRQRLALAGVKAGDLVMIESYPKDNGVAGAWSDGEASEGDDSHSGESEGSDEETEGGQEGDAEGDRDGGRVTSNATEVVVDAALSNDKDVTGFETATGGDENTVTVDKQQEVQVTEGQAHEDDIEEQDDEDVEDEEDGDQSGADNHTHLPHSIYYVHSITKEDDGTVSDVAVLDLDYSPFKPVEENPLTYHIYGRDLTIGFVPSEYVDLPSEEFISIKDVLHKADVRDYILQLNPNGDLVRSVIFYGQCPARCNNGWISTQEEMHAMVEDSIATISPHSPVCPVCIGKDLMQEHQSLREMLEATQYIDIGLVVEFYGRFNPRRRQLGYGFKQLDEREWGYYFDDISSEDDEEVNGGHDGYEYWEEAMDPSNNVVLRPVSAATIAALPRKAFAEVAVKSEATECHVCQEKFNEDVVVIELPCGHFFCEGGCVENWLKSYDTCPTCRKKVSPAAEMQEDAKTDDLSNGLPARDSGMVIEEGMSGVADREVSGGAEEGVDGAGNYEDATMTEHW